MIRSISTFNGPLSISRLIQTTVVRICSSDPVLFTGLAQIAAESLNPPNLINRYEKLQADGSLRLQRERASKIFERSDPYPRDGEIQIISTGGLIGEALGERLASGTSRNQMERPLRDDRFSFAISRPIPMALCRWWSTLLRWFLFVGSPDGAEQHQRHTSGARDWRGSKDLHVVAERDLIAVAIKYVEQMAQPVERPNNPCKAGKINFDVET